MNKLRCFVLLFALCCLISNGNHAYAAEMSVSACTSSVAEDVIMARVAAAGKNASADKKEAQAKKRVKRVIKKYVTSDMNKWEQIKVIHDWLVKNVTYDYQNYLNGTIPADSYTAYGAIIKGKSVCEGYSLAFQMFMDEMNIPCKRVVGNNHTWNMVQIGKNWYHIDVTWDDPSKDDTEKDTPIEYDYFLKSTSKLFETEAKLNGESTAHRAYKKSKYPKCTSTRFDGLYGIRGWVKQNYTAPNGWYYPYYDLSNAYYGYSKDISGTKQYAYDGPKYGGGLYRIHDGCFFYCSIMSSDYGDFTGLLSNYYASQQ